MQPSDEQWRALQDGPGQALPPREAASVIAGVLRDLARFHAAGAVHGAVDPTHVQRAGERARLADAGAAKAAPAFAAPETHAGKVATPRSDVFSAGTVFYFLLTGRSPFDGPPASVPNRVASMIPPAASAIEPRVPPALDGVLERAMAKKPEDRFATVQDFARALAEALAGTPPPRPAAATPPRGAGDDATVVRPAADEATVFQPAAADATVVRPPRATPPAPAPQRRSTMPIFVLLVVVLAALIAAGAWLVAG